MATTQKPDTAAQRGVGEDTATITEVPAPIKYPAGRLRRDCFALYGVSTSTFDGATTGIAADTEFTVAEMAERIKKWQDTPVRPATKKKEGK